MSREMEKARGATKDFSLEFSWVRAKQIGFSIVDQGCAAGGMFLVNIALARTLTKEEYGIFAIAYSVMAFLSGLHNAAILEAYTIYGSGRYHEHFDEYARLLRRSNALLCVGLMTGLCILWGTLRWSGLPLASGTTLGLGLSCGVLLTASFTRRTFYIRRRPELAAKFSGIFLLACCAFLWILLRERMLNGFSAFVTAALAWCVAALGVARELWSGKSGKRFEEVESNYWAEHWKYSRWVFFTAFIFQFTGQAYYWFVGAFLSLKEAGELRAIYNLVTPIDQVFAAMILLILPMMSFRFASQKMAGLLPLWKAYCLIALVVTCSYTLLANLFGPWFIHTLYGGKFDNVAPLFGTLAILPAMMAIGNSANAALKACERPGAVFVAYVASGASTFLIGLPLLLRFGFRGLVYAMLVSAGVYTIALSCALFLVVRSHREKRPLFVGAKEGSVS